MLNLMQTRFFTAIIILIISMKLYPQESIEQRRQKEHQAVINYINNTLPTTSVNEIPSETSIDKYKIADEINKNLSKTSAFEDRKRYLLNGNNITCEMWNYGGIGGGYQGAGLRDLLSMVWRGAPYIFQFSPIIGASVPSANNPNQRIHVISDGLYDYPSYRSVDPQNPDFFWTFEPLPGYADPNQEYMASNPGADADRDGKPDSWPRDWYNDALGEYVWPGYLKIGENNADLEVYWAMDDRYNLRHPYYPYFGDTTKKGLGVLIEGRAFQWANSLASNALFVVWNITNISDKDLDTVFFGIYGDPDLGGGTPYNSRDNGSFIPPFNVPNYPPVDNIPGYARSMVYFWDASGEGKGGVKLGYLGCKFLESPGNPDDGIDNNGNGITDERQDGGPGILIEGQDNIRAYAEAQYNIERFEQFFGPLEERPAYNRGYWWTGDVDMDWDIETDDVGIDGIPNTGDEGEGDGIPTLGKRLPDGRPDPLAPGEPNFGYTDLDEADQIGLTSFNSWTWSEDALKNNESIWNRSKPGNFGDIANNTDVVFVFGSGYISLKKGETKKISMAFLFGETLPDLLTTAETVQDIYNKNYRFFTPPEKPTVRAVPDDKKVTLYWDTRAEESLDPITGKDFEGYVIYRSTQPDFSDILNVTDGRGASYLYEPLRDLNGFEAKWDLDNEWNGYHPVPYQGRGIHYYLGDNTGLVHSFVDSNKIINGQTYYYSVVAYDHGDSIGIPPSETTKKITVDPITGEEIFDINTVKVIAGPRASGYNAPGISQTNIMHTNGVGNGNIDFEILNDLDIKDEKYFLTFSDVLTVAGKNYSVKGENHFEESFFLYSTKFADLSRQNIINDEVLAVKDKNGTVYQQDIDYELDLTKGKIKRTINSSMPSDAEYSIIYNYYSIYQSLALLGEDTNPVFDGILLKVTDNNKVEFDSASSGWIGGDLEIPFTAQLSTVGSRKQLYPADYDITFSDQNEFTALKQVTGVGLVTIPVNFKVEDITTGVPQPIIVLLNEKAKNDSAFTRGDGLILFKPGSTGVNTDTLTWEITIAGVSAGDSVYPGSGDVLRISTRRPFNNQDVFTLETQAGKIDQQDVSSLLDNIYVVPNPYVGTSMLEPDNKLPSQNRGERRIYFENLPMRCTIRIYTLSGEPVTTLEHDSAMDNGREYWNLLNKDGFSVAYGVYIAHIEAPDIGEKLIKFALIK